MYVACSTLCFCRHSLEDALQTMRELRFPKAELAIQDGGPHVTPADVLDDIGAIATRLKTANQPLAAIHASITTPDPDEARRQLRAICRLARVTTVPLVTVPAAPLGSDFAAEIVRLREWTKIAASEGVILSVEREAAAGEERQFAGRGGEQQALLRRPRHGCFGAAGGV